MGVHDRLNLAHWVAQFPLSQLRAEARDYVLQRRQKLPQEYADQQAIEDHIQLMNPKWDIVVGPGQVAVNEQLRAEAIAAGARPVRRFPTDVMWTLPSPTRWPLTTALLVSEVPAVEEPLVPYHANLHRTDDWDDAVFEGTKIGGLPNYIQDVPDVSGTFIGTIGSIAVPADQRHPFVNVAEPRGWSYENDLMIGDMGSLYIFVRPDGTIASFSQCY